MYRLGRWDLLDSRVNSGEGDALIGMGVIGIVVVVKKYGCIRSYDDEDFGSG